MTDQYISPTVEPYSALEEVVELIITIIDVLDIISLETTRSNHFLDKPIE